MRIGDLIANRPINPEGEIPQGRIPRERPDVGRSTPFLENVRLCYRTRLSVANSGTAGSIRRLSEAANACETWCIIGEYLTR